MILIYRIQMPAYEPLAFVHYLPMSTKAQHANRLMTGIYECCVAVPGAQTDRMTDELFVCRKSHSPGFTLLFSTSSVLVPGLPFGGLALMRHATAL